MPITVTTRAIKGSALTHAEMDANLNALKGGVTNAAEVIGGTINGATIGAVTPTTGKFTTLVSASIGSVSTQLHALPAVASDTVALLAAVQTLTNKTLTSPTISGNLAITPVGSGVRVSEGANAKQGIAVLVAGAVVVSNTSITANSRIFLTGQSDGGVVGFPRVSARTVGTSFTITSSSGTDTSTVAYEIFEPA